MLHSLELCCVCLKPLGSSSVLNGITHKCSPNTGVDAQPELMDSLIRRLIARTAAALALARQTCTLGKETESAGVWSLLSSLVQSRTSMATEHDGAKKNSDPYVNCKSGRHANAAAGPQALTRAQTL